MFRIGDFSKLNKISIKTLRYYDELGLLKPVKVDDETGYRYYSAAQLPKLNKILALKELGFSLQDISIIVEDEISCENIEHMLKNRENEVQQTIHNEKQKLFQLQALINKIKNKEFESMFNYNVIVKEVAPLKVASIRGIIPSYEAQGPLWGELVDYLNKMNVKILEPCVAIFYDLGFKETDVDVEVAEHISANPPSTDRIKVKDLEGVKEMASVVHKGPYESLNQAYGALMRWIEQNNYEIAGPDRELYLEGEWSTNSPENYITEIQIPVKKAL